MQWWFAIFNITANQIGVPNSTPDIGAGLGNILKLLMSLVGMLAIVFIIYGGILMATSRGNAAQVQKARETLIYAGVGLTLAIFGFAVVAYLTSVGTA